MSEADIAERLGVELQAVPTLIEIARAKLARLDAKSDELSR